MSVLLEKPTLVCHDHIMLTLESSSTPEPGQFINIRVQEGTDPLVRRPFSIYDYDNNRLKLLVRIVGRGTKIISSMEPGPVDMLGPLGTGFTTKDVKSALLIGGGVGNAPMFYLARKLKEQGTKTTMLFAARTSSYIYCEEDFKNMVDSFHTCTDDGSAGSCGLPHVIMPQLIEEALPEMVYVCGPTPMMRCVTENIPSSTPVEISMENYFGCGIGLCMGCTIETTEGLKRACVDGPVFDGRAIDWDSIQE